MLRRRSCITGIAIVAWLTPASASDAGEIVLENKWVRRVLAEQDGTWRTTHLSRTDGSASVALTSDEFMIRLTDGTELTVADFHCAEQVEVLADADPRVVVVRYVPLGQSARAALQELHITYSLADGPVLRKQIRLRMRPGAVVDRLEVERFHTEQPCTRGGRGQPVFVGPSWFVGLEYPGGESRHEQGQVTLAHFPGLAVPGDDPSGPIVDSKVAVAGTGRRSDPLELAFSDYLDSLRRPSRVLLHYNSWYDLRGDELTLDALTRTFEEFKTNVLDPFELSMDVFVPDDGWQDPQSIWLPRANLYPDGFGPLREALETRGTSLGLWIPFNGFNLDVQWGEARGYEKSDQGRYYCLVGKKYNAAIRETAERLIREGDITYLKHDFNQLRCTASGHGHPPDEHHGHEANLDAELELLALERTLQPDVFLNVTSYVWHSPWWLQHADTIWMAAGDFGYNLDWPQLAPREWAMSYRDGHFHKLYKERGVLVPLSAMMTHGIIHGRYQKLGGDQETLQEWSDYVVMYYGRGVQLMEWYITPDLMTPQRWETLGSATRWATDNREVLRNVVMVGGDPRRGEPHGYAHWLDDRGILVLRNPDVRTQDIRVPFDKSVRYRGPHGRPYRCRVIYPFVEDLPVQLDSGSPISLTLPGYAVMVFELLPGSAPPVRSVRPAPLRSASAEIVQRPDGGSEVRASIAVPDENMQRCDLYFILRRPFGAGLHGQTTVNTAALEPRRAQGKKWSVQSIDLRSYSGQTASVVATIDRPGQPFAPPPGSLSAWLVMDRPVDCPPAPSGHHPLPIGQHHRRQTVELMGETALPSAPFRRHRLSAEDVGRIEAAKLRIIGFDVNGEPRYRDKFIYLNGEKLVPVPPNSGTLSAWQEHVVDLQPKQLHLLRLHNTLEVDNPVGDYFKFSGLALAVRLPDGSWVQTPPHDVVHSSVAGWSYAEGQPFAGQRSGKIDLNFD